MEVPMMEFIIKFVTAVVTGPNNDDLVVFGPPMVVNGQPINLEAWIPKSLGARKGSEVTGNPTISVRKGAEIKKSYQKDGKEVALKTWKLQVEVQNLQFKEIEKVSLEEFFKNS
jgi:hypothetical protein